MNSWIIYDDYTSEQMDFSTDASLRRYCRQKKAKMGWRKLYDEGSPYTGMLVCVYPRNSKFGNLVIEDDAKPVSAWWNDGGEE